MTSLCEPSESGAGAAHLSEARDGVPGFPPAFAVAFAGIGVVVAALFASILLLNHGTFLYTLDDPYIHLALSDQLRHGNYGLYPGVHAAPASSILFPFLLALASGTPLHPWVPLLLNLCALGFTLAILRRFLLYLKLGHDRFAIMAQAVGLFLMAFCFNLVGVAFTGLEHGLHIAIVAATVYGLAIFLDNDRLPRWLPLLLALAPMVRYEGLALSTGVLLVLALRGRIGIALATFAAMVSGVLGFSVFLVHLGLPPLPSSVMVKSVAATASVSGTDGALLRGFLTNLVYTARHPIGMLLLLLGLFAAMRIGRDLRSGLRCRPLRLTPNGLMSLALVSLVAGQALGGRMGWLERYEDYALLGTAMMALYIARVALRKELSNRKTRTRVFAGAAACFLLFGFPYLRITALVPHTSNNIYEQQLQTHRFIDGFYRGPVAVNDLGLATYHNPYPILDLDGLGSEQARLMLARHAPAAEYETFVAAHGVHLVIVYQEWFPNQIPASWLRVATMSLSRSPISSPFADVQFYATDAATAAAVRPELAAFRASLPERVKLTIY